MNIFELMEKHDYNFIEEVIRIKNKIENNRYRSRSYNFSFFDVINQAIIEWKYNKLNYNYHEFIEVYNINVDTIAGALSYMELILNILVYLNNNRNFSIYYRNERMELIQIIDNLLSTFNKDYISNDDKIIIIENNNIVTEVLKDIKDKDYALALLQYQNVVIKNNADEKEKLLTIISKNILPLIDKYRDKKYNSKEFYKIADDLSCMLNNFHIRHNNKYGKDEKTFIHTLSNSEKIAYLDTTYNLILLLQQIENYKTIYTDKVSGLKQLL